MYYNHMKKLLNRKVLLLLLMLTMGFVLQMKAQKSDVFFQVDEVYQDRTEGSSLYILTNQHFGEDEYGGYNLYNQQFGAEVPLGSDLLIMIGAGICYTMRKCKQK